MNVEFLVLAVFVAIINSRAVKKPKKNCSKLLNPVYQEPVTLDYHVCLFNRPFPSLKNS